MCEIVPTKEVLVDPLCQIKGVLVEKDHWIIQVFISTVRSKLLPHCSHQIGSEIDFRGSLGSIFLSRPLA